MSKLADPQDEPWDKPVSSRTRSTFPKFAANSSQPPNPPSDTPEQNSPNLSNESPPSSALEKVERIPLPDTSQQAPNSVSKAPSTRTPMEKQKPNIQTDTSQRALKDAHNLFPYDSTIQKTETSRQASSSAVDSHFTDLFRQILRVQYSWSPPLQEHSTKYISTSATGNSLVFFSKEQLSEEARRHLIGSLRLDFKGNE